MDKMIISHHDNTCSPFELIKRIEDNGEVWYARDLMPLLGYKQWRRFEDSIERAKLSCQNSENNPLVHFAEFGNLVKRSQGGGSSRSNYKLTRLACYLVAMNGDPRKVEIANAQIYFALKTRQSEIQESQVTIPKTYAEALLEAGRLALEKEKLEAENALLEEQNQQLSEAVDELFDYSSIIRIAKFNNVSEKLFKWQTLKAMSIKMKVEIKRVPSPRFEWQNLYSHDVWRYCYPDFKLPETTTLVIQN